VAVERNSPAEALGNGSDQRRRVPFHLQNICYKNVLTCIFSLCIIFVDDTQTVSYLAIDSKVLM